MNYFWNYNITILLFRRINGQIYNPWDQVGFKKDNLFRWWMHLTNLFSSSVAFITFIKLENEYSLFNVQKRYSQWLGGTLVEKIHNEIRFVLNNLQNSSPFWGRYQQNNIPSQKNPNELQCLWDIKRDKDSAVTSTIDEAVKNANIYQFRTLSQWTFQRPDENFRGELTQFVLTIRDTALYVFLHVSTDKQQRESSFRLVL